MAPERDYLGLKLDDRYQVDELLARGSLCTVYRGQDIVLRRSIAVKAIAPELVESYRAALRSTMAFTHPAAIAVYDALEHDDWLFLIQEYIPARPLGFYARGVPSERAIDLASQIARVIAYAHARHLIHGDLTPTAVLVDRRATIRVNNFGLPPDSAYFAQYERALEPAQPESELATEAGDGSVSSAAGANERGDAKVAASRGAPVPFTPEAAAEDVRAIGLLLWQLLSEPTQVDRDFRRDVPDALRVLVRRCVMRSHPERITQAEILALGLESLASNLAREHPHASEPIPPALRAAREVVAREAAWSVEETQTTVRNWSANATPDAIAANAPTDQMPAERMESRRGLWQGASEIGSPRLRLPSRPVGSPARLAAVGQLGASRWNAISSREGISVPIILLIGAVLFFLFFLAGYFGPYLLGRPG